MLGSTLSHTFDSQIPVPLYWYAVYVADSVLCAFRVISKTINSGRPSSSSLTSPSRVQPPLESSRYIKIDHPNPFQLGTKPRKITPVSSIIMFPDHQGIFAGTFNMPTSY